MRGQCSAWREKESGELRARGGPDIVSGSSGRVWWECTVGRVAAGSGARTDPCMHTGGWRSQTRARRASRESDAEALDDAVWKHYDSRLSRNCDGDLILTLFDNREWNQNVRGELVVANRSTGAGELSSDTCTIQ